MFLYQVSVTRANIYGSQWNLTVVFFCLLFFFCSLLVCFLFFVFPSLEIFKSDNLWKYLYGFLLRISACQPKMNWHHNAVSVNCRWASAARCTTWIKRVPADVEKQLRQFWQPNINTFKILIGRHNFNWLLLATTNCHFMRVSCFLSVNYPFISTPLTYPLKTIVFPLFSHSKLTYTGPKFIHFYIFNHAWFNWGQHNQNAICSNLHWSQFSEHNAAHITPTMRLNFER